MAGGCGWGVSSSSLSYTHFILCMYVCVCFFFFFCYLSYNYYWVSKSHLAANSCRVSLVALMFLVIYFYYTVITRNLRISLRRRIMTHIHMFMQERNNMPIFHFIVSWLLKEDQLDTMVGHLT